MFMKNEKNSNNRRSEKLKSLQNEKTRAEEHNNTRTQEHKSRRAEEQSSRAAEQQRAEEKKKVSQYHRSKKRSLGINTHCLAYSLLQLHSILKCLY